VARNPTIAVPEEVDRALRAEAQRRGLAPREVLVAFVRERWAGWVAGDIDRELMGAGCIIDAEILDPCDAVAPRTGRGATNALTTGMVASDFTGCGPDDEGTSGGST